MIETAADRQGLLYDHDRATIAGGPTIRCRFEDPAAETLESVGHAPLMDLTKEDVEAQALAEGSEFESIRRWDGRVEGRHAIRVMRRNGAAWFRAELEAL